MPTEAKPTWVRESLCEDLAEMDRQAGRIPDTRTIEQIVDGDLQRFQAKQRERKPRPPKQKSQSNETIEIDGIEVDRNRPAASLAEKLGGKFVKRKIPDANDDEKDNFKPAARSLCSCGLTGQCKRCKMLDRIRLCLSHRGTEPRDFDWTYPALARDVMDHWMWRKMGWKIYKGHTERERDLIYIRALEDIADRSTGVLGPWWVK